MSYAFEGEVTMRLRCYCRECQYISGGSPADLMAVPEAGFRIRTGRTREYRRTDLENPVTRRFCGECGTQLVSSSPAMPDAVFIKVGTLDEPAFFERPDLAIFTVDRQPFHHVPEGVPSFERRPG